MTWGAGQLRDFLGGVDHGVEKLGKLQRRDLVLVENVKVSFFICLFFDFRIGPPTLKETSCLHLGYAVEVGAHEISIIHRKQRSGF
jgi:hypothetical protein